MKTIDDLLKLAQEDDKSIGPQLQEGFNNLFKTAFPAETPPVVFDGTKFTSTPDDLIKAIQSIKAYLVKHPQKPKSSMDERIENMVKIFSSL